MYTKGAGPVCKCTGQCTVEASFPTANLFPANFPRTIMKNFALVVVFVWTSLTASVFVRLLNLGCNCVEQIEVFHRKLLCADNKSKVLCICCKICTPLFLENIFYELVEVCAIYSLIVIFISLNNIA